MAKHPPRRSLLSKRLGRNIAAQRKVMNLTQEQLAEYLDVDTLTVSRYETGNILPPLTVLDVMSRLLGTTMADLLAQKTPEPTEHAERISIWLSGLSMADRDWVEAVVKQLIQRCQPRKRGRPPRMAKSIPDALLDTKTSP